ncbi:MAG: DUF5702 domain-containing protein [Clostridiales Family XIII bacterium]|jgi:hypothetical protein|nr:DUF5702 domain-containing protein [Clostridiales Family XIII bacterium]
MNVRRRMCRRGSITVFLAVVFACFITVSAVLFAAAKSAAGRSMADASLQLAGRSVLSEYDTRLLSDYGLLAFRGDEARIEDAIGYYADASLAPKDPLYLLFRSGGARTVAQNERCENISVNLKEYSLLDLDNFEAQIRSAALSNVAGNLLGGGDGGNGGGAAESEGRTLRSSAVIASLPSNGFQGPLFPSLGDLSDIPAMDDVMQEGTALFAASEYALSVFGSRVDGAKEDHFFSNEIEYLIAGKHSDSANYNSIKLRLTAMRFALNNAALLADSRKTATITEIALAAAAVSAETLYEPIYWGIVEAWASAETRNDILLLEHGEKVALIKTPAQWATQNPKEIWEGWTSDSPVYAANPSGQAYRDYLRIMLYILDRETKYLRMMDLMQINLKGTYRGDFLMREHYVGFRFSCTVDGDGYAYTEEY